MVITQLTQSLTKQQQDVQLMLWKLFTRIKYLARQGIAFRGHKNEESNYKQLLRMRAEDINQLDIHGVHVKKAIF